MVTIDISVAALRRAYNRNRGMGRVEVELRYCGKPIAQIDFRRHQMVDYISPTGEIIATFQDIAYLDD